MNKYKNLITYFGGKYPQLTWLIDKFPKGNYHFVDIMCGSANVALNVSYPMITINDLNDEVINLFQVLREQPEEFMRVLYFTPFSRAEICKIIEDRGGVNDPVEKARRYFVRSQLGYGANGGQNNHKGFGVEYKLHRTGWTRVQNWNRKLDKLPEIIDRLRSFQIESRDAFVLFDKLNNSDSIIYFDPPYVLDIRKSKKRYHHEWENEQHMELSKKVAAANCFVAVSGYDSELYNDLFKGFYKSVGPANRSNTGKVSRNECLWTNYNPTTINGNLEFQFSDNKINQ